MLAGVLKAALLTALLAITLLLGWAFESRDMPALQIWHTTVLEKEFTTRDAKPQSTLLDYLEREDQLFGELQERVYERFKPTDESI